MSLEIKKEPLCFSELFAKSKCEQTVNTEINLPDYCSDIKRILRCSVTAGISSVGYSGEVVSLSGTVVTRLMYIGDNDKVDCCEHISALSCETRIKDMPENPLIKTVTKTDYINCRAVSQRKVSISGSLGAMVYVYREDKKEMPTEIKGMAIECKKEKQRISGIVCQGEKTFDLSETVALENDKSDIGKILRSDCRVNLESKKAVADKLLVKGELIYEILYIDSENSDFMKKTGTMPISQIINMPGVTEKSEIFLSLTPCQFMVSPKNDSSGRCRLLEIAARVSADVRCSEDSDFEFIKDCYSTSYETDAEYASLTVKKTVMNEEKEISFEENIDISDGSVSEIKDMWCSNPGSIINSEGEYECSFLLCGIYLDNDKAVKYTEKNINIKSPLLKEKYQNKEYDIYENISDFNFSAVGGKIKISGKIKAGCHVSECKQISVLRDVKADEKAEKEEKYPALSIYFASPGEEIWDIARRYNTTVSLIKEENSVGTDRIEKEMAIMIPCV